MKALIFTDQLGHQAGEVAKACTDAGFEAVLAPARHDKNGSTFHVGALRERLAMTENDDPVLVVDGDRIRANGSLAPLQTALDACRCDILFGADYRFDFPDARLRGFYWKFHPRPGWPLPFANASCLIGRAAALRSMADEAMYYGNGDAVADQTIVNRFYADQIMGISRGIISVALDSEQRFFAMSDAPGSNTFLRAVYRSEKGRTAGDGRSSNPTRKLGLLQSHNETLLSAGFFDRIAVDAHALARTVKIAAINRGETAPSRLFRFAPNRNPEWQSAMTGFLTRLQNGTPFAFVHYNDGEMTFIRQFLEGDHRENWFGRKQNKYNPDLGRRLVEGIQHRQSDYFVGIPCRTCHPELRELADRVRPKDVMTLPAMALHHNLSHMPMLLASMRGRRIFSFKNKFQDLSVLRGLGLSIDERDVTNVPFREAHALYDEMSAMRFPDGAIILMSCGMLSKIIVPTWFQNNPKATFITLGSALDDLVQAGDPKYRPYPADLPWTGDIQGRKSFLFGRKKKPCRECFDIG